MYNIECIKREQNFKFLQFKKRLFLEFRINSFISKIFHKFQQNLMSAFCIAKCSN